MKLSRKPANQSKEKSLIFYATRLALIKSEIDALEYCYKECERQREGHYVKLNQQYWGNTTCCQRKEDEVCENCKHNKLVYKERRKLSKMLSVTMSQVLKYKEIQDKENSCKKLESSFSDLNANYKDHDYE